MKYLCRKFGSEPVSVIEKVNRAVEKFHLAPADPSDRTYP